jgi:hypothetical protein
MHPYERWITRRYLANALKLKLRENRDHPDEYFQEWVRAHWGSLALPPLECGDDHALAKFKKEWKWWRATAIVLGDEPPPEVSPLQRRIDWLSDACELNAPQRALLGLFARIARAPHVRDLVAALNWQDYRSDRFDYAELRPLFRGSIQRSEFEDGPLVRLGLIEKDDDDNFWLSELVDNILSKERISLHARSADFCSESLLQRR